MNLEMFDVTASVLCGSTYGPMWLILITMQKIYKSVILPPQKWKGFGFIP